MASLGCTEKILWLFIAKNEENDCLKTKQWSQVQTMQKNPVFGHVLYEMAISKYKSPAILMNIILWLVLLVRVPQGVAKLCAVKDKNLEKPRHWTSWSKVKQNLLFFLSSNPKRTSKILSSEQGWIFSCLLPEIWGRTLKNIGVFEKDLWWYEVLLRQNFNGFRE